MKQSFSRSRKSSQLVLTPAQDLAGQIVLTLLLALVVALSFSALWGADLLWEQTKASAFWVIPTIFASFIPHELLHAVGFILFGGVPRDAISFRTHWKNLDFQTHCAAPITVGTYRISALLPAIVLGIIPAIVSLAYGIGWLAFWSMLALSTVVTDLMDLWAIRSLSNSEMVAMTVERSVPAATPDESLP